MKHQSGVGMVGWLIIVLIVGLIMAQAFKLIPHYIESFSINSELKNIAETPEGMESMSVTDIKKQLSAFYRVNNISTEVNKGTTVSRKDGRTLIDMQYEHRVHMFYNIDAVVTFHKQLDSKFPDKCCRASE